MARLSDAQLDALRTLVARLPDAALAALVRGLPAGSGESAEVLVMLRSEARERQACADAFSPLSPFIAPEVGAAGVRLPGWAAGALWRLARSRRPDLVARLSGGKAGEDGAALRETQDAICRDLAQALADPQGAATRATVAALDEVSGGAASAATLLALAPLIRQAVPNLETWTHHLTAKSASALRSAFGAAAKLGDDAGPLFLEALSGHVAEPCRVLRLVSLILDQPTDQFLAGSALSPLCERLIGSIEAGVAQVRAFQPSRASSIEAAEGACVGAAVMRASQTLLEFEQWVEVARIGPWGGRLAALRRGLAVEVEERLRSTPRIMAGALPTRSARWSQRSARRTPKLARDPDEGVIAPAEAIAAFIGAIRSSPSTTGFAASLAQTAAALEDQLDGYVEGLLDLLHHATAEDRPRLLAFLDVTARLTEQLGGEAAGRIVRRRAAVA